jgi:hypothetical protein
VAFFFGKKTEKLGMGRTGFLLKGKRDCHRRIHFLFEQTKGIVNNHILSSPSIEAEVNTHDENGKNHRSKHPPVSTFPVTMIGQLTGKYAAVFKL